METQQEKYQRAVDRVQKTRKFYGKIVNTVIVCIILAAINYYLNELRHPWVLWVVGFSLLGIIIDAFKLYGMDIFLGRGWEQRKIKQEMEKGTKPSNTIIRK